ncbi:quinone oxidoreductase [Halioglobus japonicus]|uniref:NADPH:quinone reductase n=1 Tax=Halioglobus japonicus TaxID=930805 RepID=A0AAP8MFW5_9GAMM|nr:quinone oxidoreductase [Halioglobus japonicus]AQA19853.1 quinone oxidoreductase [Halioglobus japonicus]PLW87073.1 quinone oxidoreductase [Halioglobus japonicus]GHD10351.1 quinone oxidoreductase [Halioglobus japonicus]
MVKRVSISENGGPGVMQLVDEPLEAPGTGMVTVRNHAIGLNYIDTYHRSGLYPLPLPTGLGGEGAGVVEAVGEGVDLPVATRVGYCSAGLGAYAEAVNLPAARLVPLPDGIDFDTAAASLLKGQTTEYLIQRTYSLQADEYCLFHAAAGGVGLLFGQWAAAIGAKVIGTVGSDEKAALARAHGYAHVINYRTENVVERVMEITGGAMLPVVYDGVGADTFDMSLDCLRPRGLMVSFGNASGAPAPLELQTLTAKGSLYITRPTMVTYTATAEELQQSSTDLFNRIVAGDIRVEINQRYALGDIQQAHSDLEGRKTTGSTVILP